MKKLFILASILMTVTLTSYSQSAVRVSNIERMPTAQAVSADNQLLATFENGSIPYPSAEAEQILQMGTTTERMGNGPMGKSYSFYYPVGRRHPTSYSTHPSDFEELPRFAQLIIGLAFISLANPMGAGCPDMLWAPQRFREIDAAPLSAEQIPPPRYPVQTSQGFPFQN
ncbi:MAG: hypothetical protein AAFZ15_08680 [Bacteroidota bacterium]